MNLNLFHLKVSRPAAAKEMHVFSGLCVLSELIQSVQGGKLCVFTVGMSLIPWLCLKSDCIVWKGQLRNTTIDIPPFNILSEDLHGCHNYT